MGHRMESVWENRSLVLSAGDVVIARAARCLFGGHFWFDGQEVARVSHKHFQSLCWNLFNLFWAK